MSYRDRLPHEIPLPEDNDMDMNWNSETKKTKGTKELQANATVMENKEEQKDLDEDDDDENENETFENEYLEELDTGTHKMHPIFIFFFFYFFFFYNNVFYTGEHSPEFINQLLDEMESKYKVAWSTLSDDQLTSGCDCLSHLNYATKLIQFYKSNEICWHMSNGKPSITSQIKMTPEKQKHIIPFETGLALLENNRKQKEDLFNRWLQSLKNETNKLLL